MSGSPDLAGVFRTLNEMAATGVIEEYAVGGAVAAIFYAEPRETFDLDVFFVLSTEPSNPLARLEAIYQFARDRGFEPHAEFIRMHGWAVQFLEGAKPLWKDAVRQARTLRFEREVVRVIDPEFLAAMMVETGRSKDWIRLADFFESNVLDRERFETILRRYDLWETWVKQKWRIDDWDD